LISDILEFGHAIVTSSFRAEVTGETNKGGVILEHIPLLPAGHHRIGCRHAEGQYIANKGGALLCRIVVLRGHMGVEWKDEESVGEC